MEVLIAASAVEGCRDASAMEDLRDASALEDCGVASAMEDLIWGPSCGDLVSSFRLASPRTLGSVNLMRY